MIDHTTLLLIVVAALLLVAVGLLIAILVRQGSRKQQTQANQQLTQTMFNEFDQQRDDIENAMKNLADDVKGTLHQIGHSCCSPRRRRPSMPRKRRSRWRRA